ncbi:MAG TPA: hypothetical protein VHR66_08805 [Gemmataceae bacterium]|jgi:hypothetical protein|nr:hypothetical protein [Gemmataceae bacterium]
MTELLSHFKPGEFIGLVAVAGGLLIPIFAVLGGAWTRARMIALKREMIERGMSADEIHTVLTAGTKSCPANRRERHSERV